MGNRQKKRLSENTMKRHKTGGGAKKTAKNTVKDLRGEFKETKRGRFGRPAAKFPPGGGGDLPKKPKRTAGKYFIPEKRTRRQISEYFRGQKNRQRGISDFLAVSTDYGRKNKEVTGQQKGRGGHGPGVLPPRVNPTEQEIAGNYQNQGREPKHAALQRAPPFFFVVGGGRQPRINRWNPGAPAFRGTLLDIFPAGLTAFLCHERFCRRGLKAAGPSALPPGAAG